MRDFPVEKYYRDSKIGKTSLWFMLQQSYRGFSIAQVKFMKEHHLSN